MMTTATLVNTTMAGALLAATLAAAPAAAVIKVATYRGTVSSGYDQTGEFGAPHTDLTGLSFVATYVYDTARGYRSALVGHDQVWGGSAYGVPSPIVRASITIGRASVSFESTNSDGLAVVDQGYYGNEIAEFQPPGGAMLSNDFMENYGFRRSSTSNLDVSFGAKSLSSNDYGYIQIYTHDGTTGTDIHYAYADLGAATLAVASAPEPATWGLMLGGLSAVGTVARRRRAPTAGARVSPTER